MEYLERHVFVLGAGASKESANTPLGKDLVWNYHSDCADLLPDINGTPDQSEENVIFFNFSEFIRLAASIYPEELAWLPKEWKNRGWAIFDLHEKLLKKHYVDEMLKYLQEQKNKTGTELVKQLIFEHISTASIDSSNTPNKLYKRFVKEILKNKPPQTTSIISLNFDCLLHEDYDSQVYFDYFIDFDCIDPRRKEFYRHSDPIPLIKLHGSMDWGICSNCGRLHLYYPFMHRTFYEGKVCTKQECEGKLTPFIVIPHDKERIIPLWNVARNHLKEAHRVTVIGYSFPEYDKDMIKLFRDSLDTNVCLEVVDFCPNDQRKKEAECFKRKYINKLFPDIEPSPKITMNGFSGYLDVHGKL